MNAMDKRVYVNPKLKDRPTGHEFWDMSLGDCIIISEGPWRRWITRWHRYAACYVLLRYATDKDLGKLTIDQRLDILSRELLPTHA